jgi:hypothetical protein
MEGKAWFITAYVLAMIGLPGWLSAYVLSESDYAILKTDITVTHQAEFAAAVAASDDTTIAAAYNLVASPSCWVWGTAIAERANYETTTDIGTTWDWDLYSALQQGNRDSWVRMFATGPLDASHDNNRAALAKIFKAPAAAQATHVLAVWRRQALRGEALYVTPLTGACSTTTPAKVTWEGPLTGRQIGHALRNIPLQ